MKDPLLAEIAADPASDDARLVWADREGGDRGELVVVQCALARGAGDRPTRRRLYARERELLENVLPTAETAGLEEPRFERGFIVHASVKIDDLQKLLARHPLLTSVELADARVDIPHGEVGPPWSDTGRRIANLFGDLAPGRVAKVKANPWLFGDRYPVPQTEDHLPEFLGAIAGTHAGRALRGLEFVRQFPEDALPWLDGFKALEELRIEAGKEDGAVVRRMGIASFRQFTETHPALTCLELRHGSRSFYEIPALARFRELDLGGAGYRTCELRLIAHTPMPRLRRLGLAWTSAERSDVEELAASETLAHIEALDIGGSRFDDEQIAILTRAKFAPNLRVLELRDTSKLTGAAIPHLLSFPKLDRLDLRSSYGDTQVLAPLKDVIPWVAL